MTEPKVNRLAAGLGVASVGSSLVVVIAVLISRDVELTVSLGSIGIALVAYGAVGGLIAARSPRNSVGWLLVIGALVIAAPLSGFAVATTLGPHATDMFPRGLREVFAWGFLGLALPFGPACIIVALLRFPDGRVANRWFLLPAALPILASAFILLRNVASPGGWIPQELGVHFGPAWARQLPGAGGFGLAGDLLLAVSALTIPASLIVRRRRATEDERRPLRWLMRMLLGLGALLLMFLALGATAAAMESDDWAWYASMPLTLVAAAIVLFGIPASLMLGALTARDYDVESVVKKTLVGAAMVGFVVATFMFLALYIPLAFRESQSLDLWGLVPAIVVAVGIGPLRRRVRQRVDHVLYGERATPYEVLSEFSERVGETYSIDDVMPRMVAVLGEATGAERAVAWLRVGTSLRPVAIWPTHHPMPVAIDASSELTRDGGAHAFEVRHHGDALGALTLSMLPSDPMNPSKERLAHDLAAQAGLVLRNIALIEDLRDSRKRLVAAQDEERRKLERNIHDGAQQQLVALQVKLRLAEQLADRDLAKAKELLGQLQTETGAALDDLRDLARGIYPPLLADKGLAAALQAQARKAAVPTTVQTDGIERYPQDIEAAVYFSCLEAMQNVAKYAEASRTTVQLAQTNGSLTFTVTDDGRGFDTDQTTHGSGLQGMADRLDAIGGSLHVKSEPGRGTTVSGNIPASVGSAG